MTMSDARDPDPGDWLLDKIDAREQTLTCQIEQIQAEIDALTARLGELGQATEHLRITRKTLLTLAADTADDPEPATPSPALPGHPLYQQILTVFADHDRLLRARELCAALDLPQGHNDIQNVRVKLKRLVSRGILAETEPGLFTQPRP